ncbi:MULTISPECIES: hypothetical protein [unclassified Rhodococcus (in: high G+C Gram-positive bacteria)]|nr:MULTISPECIES: hypothetical protein [unclassified Rhodococcus (in: high G+C Gram-positive bacteria)]
MSVCETCWATASFTAAMVGGDVVEHYHAILADIENRGIHHPEWVTP